MKAEIMALRQQSPPPLAIQYNERSPKGFFALTEAQE
jgi:hypothetical protein